VRGKTRSSRPRNNKDAMGERKKNGRRTFSRAAGPEEIQPPRATFLESRNALVPNRGQGDRRKGTRSKKKTEEKRSCGAVVSGWELRGTFHQRRREGSERDGVAYTLDQG